MDLVEAVISGGVGFIRHAGGILTKPYATYRSIVDKGKLTEVLYVMFVCAAYFAVASLVKTQAFRPFLLTRHFLRLSLGAGAGYICLLLLLYGIGRIVGGKGSFRGVAIAWAYSLLPTVIWFLVTSLLYIVLPPPRTTAPLGILFSILYLVFSAVLFYWKAELYYLTLRFGLRLDLIRIIAASSGILLFSVLYSILMYRLNIFKVPFL